MVLATYSFNCLASRKNLAYAQIAHMLFTTCNVHSISKSLIDTTLNKYEFTEFQKGQTIKALIKVQASEKKTQE